MTKPTVGFIGLGNMGAPMAANLVADGFTVSAHDIVVENVSALKGARACSTSMEAARDVDVLISMLPAGEHVRSLYLGSASGEPGLLEALDRATLVVDCSTIDPASAIAVAERGAQLGIDVLDAPVSGGTAGAMAGTLTFIVGGDAGALERAEPVLACMGGQTFHAGAAGAGQIAKICNNMLLAVQMAGTAEALALGVDNGLDPATLSAIMQASSGGNWTLNVYNPYPKVMDGVPAADGYRGGFVVDLMNKDLGLAMQTAQTSRSSVPLGALAQNLYRVHTTTNDAGNLDFSSIQYLYEPGLKGAS
jgi:3-hydroxyisobutyrate dehydrogenase